MLKEPEGRTRYLSEDERVRYLDACKKISPTLHTASMIALTTGGRKMEVWDLKRADVHIAKEEGERSFVTFRETKTGPVRSVTLIEPALEVFKKLPLRLDTHQIFP